MPLIISGTCDRVTEDYSIRKNRICSTKNTDDGRSNNLRAHAPTVRRCLGPAAWHWRVGYQREQYPAVTGPRCTVGSLSDRLALAGKVSRGSNTLRLQAPTVRLGLGPAAWHWRVRLPDGVGVCIESYLHSSITYYRPQSMPTIPHPPQVVPLLPGEG